MLYRVGFEHIGPASRRPPNQRRRAEILTRFRPSGNPPWRRPLFDPQRQFTQFAAASWVAAICYSKVAPDVPRALHMPSHISLGWDVAAINQPNRAAHAAALAYVRKTLGPECFDTETVHTMDYLNTPTCQTARIGGKTIIDELSSWPKLPPRTCPRPMP